MAIAAGDALKIVVSMLFQDNVVMMNVFHWTIDTIVGSGSDAEIGADAVNYIEDLYIDIGKEMSNTMIPQEVVVYVWDTVGLDWDEVVSNIWADLFLDVADPLPHGVALVQTFKTTDPDVDGRKFWGGYTEGDQAAGSWVSGALVNAVLTGAKVVAAYTDAVSLNVYTPGVWSVKTKAMFGYSGAFVTNAVVGYQRRRKPGVGI